MPKPRRRSTEEIEQAAKRYDVCGRTIRRWLADGVDVDDLEAVGSYLLAQRNSSRAALEATRKNLISDQ